MSSRPGLTLEAWLEDEYFLVLLDDRIIGIPDPGRLVPVRLEQFTQLVTLFEPHRDYVEDKLLDFDEENQSWRAYNSAVFDSCFPDELLVQAQELVSSWRNR
jgi:hypothetical protein